MHEPAWKKLVEQLKQGGYKSPYLDRLKARIPAAALPVNELAAEILREMASALRRSEDKVNAALLALEVEGKKIDALTASGRPEDREEIAMRVIMFNRYRAEAEQALWELRVHREALGFRRNDDLSEHYPIPPKRC